MKKVGLIAAAMFFAAATFAQTTTPAVTPMVTFVPTQPIVAQGDKTKITPADTAQMKALDNCIRNYNSEKAMAKRSMLKGEFKVSKAAYAIADADKKYIKAMTAQLKSEGVRRPLMLAHREIKKADKKMIIADVKIIKADKLAKKKALKAGDTTAVKVAEDNLIADKNNLKKDIREASHDEAKHFAFVRPKS
jgi:hypothetical protein